MKRKYSTQLAIQGVEQISFQRIRLESCSSIVSPGLEWGREQRETSCANAHRTSPWML